MLPTGTRKREIPDATQTALSDEYESLMRRSYHRAYSAAYRMMGNASDAEDLTQEAFVRVWAAFDRYDRSRSFEGWLFRILSNLAIDRWRRGAGTLTCSLDAESNSAKSFTTLWGRPQGGSRDGNSSTLLSCLADERPSVMPEQSLFRAEVGRKVRTALAALPCDYRKAVLLADVQGYSYEEIANHVGCPVGTIRSRLHRGRQLLRQNLQRLQHSEEAADSGEYHLNREGVNPTSINLQLFASLESA
jgi:RNA polymerase sigma-70 factor (ECF subfamily)